MWAVCLAGRILTSGGPEAGSDAGGDSFSSKKYPTLPCTWRYPTCILLPRPV